MILTHYLMYCKEKVYITHKIAHISSVILCKNTIVFAFGKIIWEISSIQHPFEHILRHRPAIMVSLGHISAYLQHKFRVGFCLHPLTYHLGV